MQRVFEMQSSWDEREKLRHFAISRPPVQPPWPIQSPTYKPDLYSLYSGAGAGEKRITNQKPEQSNSGSYAFKQNFDINNEDDGKINPAKMMELQNSLERQVRDTKKEIAMIKNEEYYDSHHHEHEKKDYSNEVESISDVARIDSQKNIGNIGNIGNNSIKENKDSSEVERISSAKDKNKDDVKDDASSEPESTYNGLVNKIYKEVGNAKGVDKNMISQMVVGKNKKDIDGYSEFIKKNTEVLNAGNKDEKKINNDAQISNKEKNEISKRNNEISKNEKTKINNIKNNEITKINNQLKTNLRKIQNTANIPITNTKTNIQSLVNLKNTKSTSTQIPIPMPIHKIKSIQNAPRMLQKLPTKKLSKQNKLPNGPMIF